MKQSGGQELLEELGSIRLELANLVSPMREAKEAYLRLAKHFEYLCSRREIIEREITPVVKVVPKKLITKEINVDDLLARFDTLPIDTQTMLINKLAGRNL